MIYFHIMVAVFALIVCYKWGDWRHWKKYYSTIQFFIMGDYLYNILFRNKMLWLYVSTLLNHTLINMFIGVFGYSSTVMVFIPYFPKGLLKRVVYILSWVLLFSIVEYIAYYLGFFTYDNGWNILWSVVFCLVLFPLLYLHYRKPLWAWFFTIIELIIYLIIFKVDVLSLV